MSKVEFFTPDDFGSGDILPHEAAEVANDILKKRSTVVHGHSGPGGEPCKIWEMVDDETDEKCTMSGLLVNIRPIDIGRSLLQELVDDFQKYLDRGGLRNKEVVNREKLHNRAKAWLEKTK